MKYSFADDAIKLPPAYAETEAFLVASLATRRAQATNRTLENVDPITGSWYPSPAAQTLSDARYLATRDAVEDRKSTRLNSSHWE